MRAHTNGSDTLKSPSEASKQDVVDAAIRCFRQYGSGRTTMGDIAEASGISRKTLYRLFEDRPALINRVLSQILSVMGQKVEEKLQAYASVREAFIEGSIVSVSVGLRDKLFNDIIKSETHYRVEQFLMLGNSRVRADMVRIWSPIIDAGRKEGVIRSDLTNERITEILQNVHSLLFIRDDESEESQRELLKDLLWAAVTNTKLS